MGIVKTKTTPTIEVPAMTNALAYVAAEKAFAKASDDLEKALSSIFTTYATACAGLPKTEAVCDSIGKQVVHAICEAYRTSMPRLKGVSKAYAESLPAWAVWDEFGGEKQRKLVVEYGQGVQRAFFFGVPWTSGLKNSKAHYLPWSKAAKTAKTAKGTKGVKGAKGAKTGPIETTTNEAMFETLYKALRQARMLNRTEFAGAFVDVCHEWLAADGFKEPAKTE